MSTSGRFLPDVAGRSLPFDSPISSICTSVEVCQDGCHQKGLYMRYLKLLLIALASALCATYLVLWLTKPAPLENTTIPPLIFKEERNALVIWGGWKTVEGYQAPGTNAVEIRCNRTFNTCNEAVASILHHFEGEDLEAHYLVSGKSILGKHDGECAALRLERSGSWNSYGGSGSACKAAS